MGAIINPIQLINYKRVTPVKYGLLYNWYAVTDAKNIANTGWKVPSYSDFLALLQYIEPASDWTTNTVGGKLRMSGLTYWSVDTGTNDYHFNAKGNGERTNTSTFAQLNNNGFLHCSDAMMETFSYRVYSNTALKFWLEGVQKTRGMALRLLKISTAHTHGQTGTYIGNDEKLYRTITIGDQEWLDDNLVETKYRTGEDIPEVTDDVTWAALTSGALCAYDNDWDNVLI